MNKYKIHLKCDITKKHIEKNIEFSFFEDAYKYAKETSAIMSKGKNSYRIIGVYEILYNIKE